MDFHACCQSNERRYRAFFRTAAQHDLFGVSRSSVASRLHYTMRTVNLAMVRKVRSLRLSLARLVVCARLSVLLHDFHCLAIANVRLATCDDQVIRTQT